MYFRSMITSTGMITRTIFLAENFLRVSLWRLQNSFFSKILRELFPDHVEDGSQMKPRCKARSRRQVAYRSDCWAPMERLKLFISHGFTLSGRDLTDIALLGRRLESWCASIHYNMWQHQVHRIAEMLVKMPIFSPMQKRSAATGAEDASNLTEISWIATWYDMNIEFFCAGLTCCWWWTRAPRALLIWFCAPLRPTSHLWVETVQSHAPIARRQRCLKGATATKAVAKFTDGTMYNI